MALPGTGQSLFESYESSYCTASTGISDALAALSSLPLRALMFFPSILYPCALTESSLPFFSLQTNDKTRPSNLIKTSEMQNRLYVLFIVNIGVIHTQHTHRPHPASLFPRPQLQRLDMEARSAPAEQSRAMLQKVKEYRADIKKLKDDVKRAATGSTPTAAGGSALARAELGLADDYYQTSAGQRDRLLSATERLGKTSERIQQGRQQLIETEVRFLVSVPLLLLLLL